MDLAAAPRTDVLTTPDGARLRWGAWPEPEGRVRGTVLILNGRSEFIEKYRETAGELIARGFRVFGFDWRGQGLSSRTPTGDETGHYDSFDPLVRDAALIADRVVRPAGEGPLILLGHSMGGHLALRLLAARPDLAAGAILTAPMVMPITLSYVRQAARLLSPMAAALGRGRGYAPGEGGYDPDRMLDPRRLLSSDPVRNRIHADWFRDHPEYRVSGITWGWLAAAFRSAAAIRQGASGIRVPVLMLLAGRESLVDNGAARQVARRMPHCRVSVYPDALHEILMERDDIRGAFWRDADGFLATLAP
ncbi:alpha/beta fold hydrolase [Inquilinus sp. Marseille-Q2685]|uniref:alpha/beta fold hydrolase n=1 Tax=Inquilinus sp. Marseille-Q2685 TaxID=2866581 RepID=UPI001CE4B2DE|nr:alpha/beta hydrolase [Inquilinus sp. Marseille-Q2685]